MQHLTTFLPKVIFIYRDLHYKYRLSISTVENCVKLDSVTGIVIEDKTAKYLEGKTFELIVLTEFCPQKAMGTIQCYIKICK